MSYSTTDLFTVMKRDREADPHDHSTAPNEGGLGAWKAPTGLAALAVVTGIALTSYVKTKRASERIESHPANFQRYTWGMPLHRLKEMVSSFLPVMMIDTPRPEPIENSPAFSDALAVTQGFEVLTADDFSKVSPSTNPHAFLAWARRKARDSLQRLDGAYFISKDVSTRHESGYSDYHQVRDYSFAKQNDALPENGIVVLSDVDHYVQESIPKILARGNVVILHQFWPKDLTGTFGNEAAWTVDFDGTVTFSTNPGDVHRHGVFVYPPDWSLWGQDGVYSSTIVSGKTYTYPSPCPLHRFVVLRPTFKGGNPDITTSFKPRLPNVYTLDNGSKFMVEHGADHHTIYLPNATDCLKIDANCVSSLRMVATSGSSAGVDYFRVSDAASVLRTYKKTPEEVQLWSAPLAVLAAQLGLHSPEVPNGMHLTFYDAELAGTVTTSALNGAKNYRTNILLKASNFAKGPAMLRRAIYSLYYSPRAGKVFTNTEVLSYCDDFVDYLEWQCGDQQLDDLNFLGSVEHGGDCLEITPRVISSLEENPNPLYYEIQEMLVSNRLDIFPKGEAMKPGKVCRCIVNAAYESVVRMSFFSQPLAAWLCKSEHYGFVDPTTLAGRVSLCVDKCVDSAKYAHGGVVLAADASKYDSNQSAFSRAVLYKVLTRKFGSYEPLIILASQSGGVWSDGDSHFALGNSQASGCATTSVQNTLFNMFMHYVAVRYHTSSLGMEYSHELMRSQLGLFAGDDSIAPAHFQAELCEVSAQTNVPLEMVAHSEMFDFLGKYFLVKHYYQSHRTNLACVPVPARVLRSVGLASPSFKMRPEVGIYVKLRCRSEELDTIPGLGQFLSKLRRLLYSTFTSKEKKVADSYVPADEKYHVRGQGLTAIEWLEIEQYLSDEEMHLIKTLREFTPHFHKVEHIDRLFPLLAGDIEPHSELGIRNIPGSAAISEVNMKEDRVNKNAHCAAFMKPRDAPFLWDELALYLPQTRGPVFDCRAGSKNLAAACPRPVIAFESNSVVYETFMQTVTPNVTYINEKHVHDYRCAGCLHIYDPMWTDVNFLTTTLKSEKYTDVVAECADRPTLIITDRPFGGYLHSNKLINNNRYVLTPINLVPINCVEEEVKAPVAEPNPTSTVSSDGLPTSKRSARSANWNKRPLAEGKSGAPPRNRGGTPGPKPHRR